MVARPCNPSNSGFFRVNFVDFEARATPIHDRAKPTTGIAQNKNPSNPQTKAAVRLGASSFDPLYEFLTGMTGTPHFTQTTALSLISAPQFLQYII